MKTEDVKWLHVEASSKCNAWCPACPRNKNGFGVVDWLIEQDLASARFQEVLNQLPRLTGIQFCGNFGDPIIAHNILELIEIAKSCADKIQIHTNGSLRTTDWWAQLAHLLQDIDHDVWFGIDGIGKTHEIYRQATSYEKIIANASAFITGGGYATWQFIPYQHNEHQIKDCIRTSQKIGFKKFKLVKLYRNQRLARNYRTGEEFDLLPPTEFQHLVKTNISNSMVDPNNCMHLNPGGIYLSALGQLSTCCYFSGKKQFDTVDKLLYNLVDFNNQTCLTNCGS
jgi:sulfatase maturation enzyme AslB (radical SAM superfamily)